MAKHVHEWYPISKVPEDAPTRPIIFKTKVTPRGISPRPRGFPKDGGPQPGENVIWSCRRRDHHGNRCMQTLYYLGAWRLKAKGEFEEVEEPQW